MQWLSVLPVLQLNLPFFVLTAHETRIQTQRGLGRKWKKQTAFVRLCVHTPHGPQANTASIVKRKQKKSNRKPWGAVDQTRLKQLNVKTMSRRSCRGGRCCLLWLIRVNWQLWPDDYFHILGKHSLVFIIFWIKKEESVGRIATTLGFGSNC